MAANTTDQVVAPWGYDYQSDQDAVQGVWEFQLFSSIVLGGYYWDTIISLPGDCEFVFRRRFNYVTVLFLVNRFSGIVTLTTSWLFTVYTGNECLAVYKLGVISEPITIFTSQALLLIRVRALYRDNLYLLVFMTLFMFSGPLLDLTEAFLTTASNLPDNAGCAFGPSSPYIYLVFLLQALFDCLCFVLCTYKLFKIAHGGTLMNIGREMLNGGLVYYIPNVITQVATVVLTLQQGSDIQFLSPPAADGVASAQALRVTRGLWKSGQDQTHETQGSTGLLQSHSKSGDSSLPNDRLLRSV